jgi:predicted alpha-1,2-mannosidase
MFHLKPTGSGRFLSTFAGVALFLISRVDGAENLTQFVNPFIGTAPGGNNFGFYGNSGDVFPGAAFPRGLFQFSPDTPSGIAGGYNYPDTTIKGFSVRHFSGRGIPCYQDFAFMPLIGLPLTSPATSGTAYHVGFSHTNETSVPGYYRVGLNNGVQVELTATLRTGMARFTFPNTNAATLLVNASSSIGGTAANTVVLISGTNQIQGYATATIGGGTQLYTIYFAAQFDHAFTSVGTWNGGTMNTGSVFSTGSQVGAYLTFDATTNPVILAKAGISFVSAGNAVANLNAENPDWDFATIQSAADAAWNNLLNKIVISGGSTNLLQTFYTALYHCGFHPNIFNDANGQYRGMDGQVHSVAAGHSQYENIPAWDVYRSASALTALLFPDEASDIAQSLVNHSQQGGGGLPRWQQVNRNSGGMAGDGPLPILATTYVLGATNFDTVAALAAMNLNAGTIGTKSDGNLVRPGLSDYLNLGHIPGLASVTLEYCSDDFALAQFAKALGDTDKYNTYFARSGNWRNLFNNVNGLLQPRNSDGSWVSNVTATTQAGFVEGSAAQYFWLVPFNLRGLFDTIGGNSNAVSRLDNFFTKLNDGVATQYAFMGNEPCEGDPWEYDYAGAPSKTQDTVRRIQTQLFKNTPGGLPGNDDAGSLSSWYVFSALGFYPLVPGVGGFVIGSPLFTNATIHLANGQQIIIQGVNASVSNSYVQSLTINGTNATQLWLPFETIRNGAELVFTLSNTPSAWGTGTSNAPPSFESGVANLAPVPALVIFNEAESLATADASPGLTNRLINNSNFSGGSGTILDATAIGNYLTFLITNVPVADYEVRIGIKQLNSRGIWQLAIGNADDFSNTAVNVGAPHDEYAPIDVYTEVDLGTWSCRTAGDKWFQFKIVEKNTSSTGYLEAFDYIRLVANPPMVLGASPLPDRTHLAFTWPGWAASFKLFSTPDLTPPLQWSSVTNSPAITNGMFYLVLPVTNAAHQFFRLQSQ